MVPPMSFDFRERAFSFRYAWRGIGLVIRTQHNAWIHIVATVTVIGRNASPVVRAPK